MRVCIYIYIICIYIYMCVCFLYVYVYVYVYVCVCVHVYIYIFVYSVCVCVRQVGSEAIRRCDPVTLRYGIRVFASLRRCDAAGRLLASLRYRDAATLRHCDADGVPLRDAAKLHAVGSLRLRVFRLKLRAAARFFAVSRRCVDASDAATLQPWGGWWVGLHAVVTSMYWLKQWGLDQISLFANKHMQTQQIKSTSVASFEVEL